MHGYGESQNNQGNACSIQYDDNLVGLEIALRIVLLIFILLFALKANESAASSSCDGDVNTCTPKQIC